MNRYPHFTLEQIEILKANPYTAYVSNDTLKHTLAFKKFAVKEYSAGKKPSQIYASAGYDPKMIGTSRMSVSIKHFRTQAASAKGLQPSTAETHTAQLQAKINP